MDLYGEGMGGPSNDDNDSGEKDQSQGGRILVLIFNGLQQYGVGCWCIKKILWPVIAEAFQNFILYQFAAGLLQEAVDWCKRVFYICLGYFGIGFFGLIGAIGSIQIMLWPYFIYLLISW